MTKRKFLITVFILIATVSLGINLLFDNQNKQQNQDQTMNNQQGVPAQSNNAGQANTQNADALPSPTSGTTGGSEAESSPEVADLQAEIEEKYIDRLQATGSSYEARINSLLSSAIIDYQAAKEADPSADITPLTEKYYSAGKALEAECDDKMYAIMADFENELRANSLPVDAAISARATYAAEKSSKAAQFL
ncbi:MAG: hypothetical protein PHT62_05915 [Desulfotomaculaceae bacterium]|nr:hypothetical protein [Desulfotomaculaceae bacterium]